MNASFKSSKVHICISKNETGFANTYALCESLVGVLLHSYFRARSESFKKKSLSVFKTPFALLLHSVCGQHALTVMVICFINAQSQFSTNMTDNG